MNKKNSILCVAAGLAFIPFAYSQSDDSLKKLGNFQTTGKAEFTVIDQKSDSADAIRKTLQKIKLPEALKSAFTLWCPMRGTWRLAPRVSSPLLEPVKPKSGQ